MQISNKNLSLITLDFETYFSSEYSLRNKELNTSEYVRHKEFKAQCVGIKTDDEPVVWYRDCDVAQAISSIDWSNAALLAHNTAFDGFILSHHYGVKPAYYLDTLSMARALHSNAIGASLDSVATFYRLGNKLPNVLDKSKGVRDLPPELMEKMGQYCALDVELCRLIFDKMLPAFPQAELDLIDLTLRMFCDPVLEIDRLRVEAELERELRRKERLIKCAGVPLGDLSSSNKFAEHLMKLGLEPPTKVSPKTKKVAWAFSKSDLEFIDLKHHKDKRVRRLVNGRLAAKSTIGETRAYRFIQVAENGKLPVLLNYFGAHTGRWSAGNKMNLQNLKRKGELRRSILAPEGHVIVVADSSQIEARMTAWLANDYELLDLFATGADVYKHMASQIYLVPVDQITSEQRFIGKIAVLGLGYGMGWKKFQHTLATGAMGPVVHLPDSECQRIVSMYRSARLAIAKLWKRMDFMLYSMFMKRLDEYGPLRSDEECRIWLPNDLYLQYPFLNGSEDEFGNVGDYHYYDFEDGMRMRMLNSFDKEKGKKIYGGLLTENVVQALARIVVADQMLSISTKLRETGGVFGANPDVGVIRKVVTMTHDEVVVVVPEEEGQLTLDLMINEMRKPPAWCAGLKLNAEGGFDVNYSK